MVVDQGVREVVETTAGIPVKSGKMFPIIEPKILGEMSAIIGFAGVTLSGAVIIHYSKGVAAAIMKNLFDTEMIDINDEVLDAMGEITNMICGKIKSEMCNMGEPDFNISVPTIVVGENYLTYIRGVKADSVVFPYTTDEDATLNIEVKLQKKA